MLNHPTLDKLEALRFNSMVKALTEQMAVPDIEELSFEERLGLLVDREMTEREDRRLKTRLRQAKLRQTACVEDIDYRHPRGTGQVTDAGSCRLSMDQTASQYHDHRPHRCGQDLDRLRTGTKSLPGGS